MLRIRHKKMSRCIIAFLLLSTIQLTAQESWSSKYVRVKKDGTITYSKDELGNSIPDFSGVGYKQNRKPLPIVPVVKTVDATADNDEQTIQAAVDEVAKMKPDVNGFRGAIL